MGGGQYGAAIGASSKRQKVSWRDELDDEASRPGETGGDDSDSEVIIDPGTPLPSEEELEEQLEVEAPTKEDVEAEVPTNEKSDVEAPMQVTDQKTTVETDSGGAATEHAKFETPIAGDGAQVLAAIKDGQNSNPGGVDSPGQTFGDDTTSQEPCPAKGAEVSETLDSVDRELAAREEELSELRTAPWSRERIERVEAIEGILAAMEASLPLVVDVDQATAQQCSWLQERIRHLGRVLKKLRT